MNQITDRAVRALAEKCPKLHYLSVACCPALTDASLIALAQHSSMLSTLNVAGCTQFTDAGFQALARVGFPFCLYWQDYIECWVCRVAAT